MAKDIFIATEPIFVGRVRAYNPGDAVTTDAVKRNGWEDKVAREGTKAAEAVTPEPVEAPKKS